MFCWWGEGDVNRIEIITRSPFSRLVLYINKQTLWQQLEFSTNFHKTSGYNFHCLTLVIFCQGHSQTHSASLAALDLASDTTLVVATSPVFSPVSSNFQGIIIICRRSYQTGFVNRSFLLDTALDLFTSTNFVAATTLFSADFIETFRILLCQSDVDVFYQSW